MPRRRGPFADYDPADLVLLDERARPEMFQRIHSIYVPRDVWVVEGQLGLGPLRGPWIVYPMPESWRSSGTDASAYDLLRNDQWRWENGEPFSADALLARWRRGMSAWGLGGADTSRLLNDFLPLAREGTTTSKGQKVVRFVRQWGPLWLCRTPAHHVDGRRCYWHPGQRIYWGGATELCSWQPVEEVAAFVREAEQACAVVQAAAILRNAKLVDRDIWQRLEVCAPGDTIADQQSELMRIVQARLAIHWRGFEMTAIWLAKRTGPQCSFVSKIGFIHAVWIGITLLICGVRDCPICTGCGWPYIRNTKAKEGLDNFCPECSWRTRERQSEQSPDITNRAAKRLYAERLRNLKRRARQLADEGKALDEIVREIKRDARRMRVDTERVQTWIRK